MPGAQRNANMVAMHSAPSPWMSCVLLSAACTALPHAGNGGAELFLTLTRPRCPALACSPALLAVAEHASHGSRQSSLPLHGLATLVLLRPSWMHPGLPYPVPLLPCSFFGIACRLYFSSVEQLALLSLAHMAGPP
jgi:hypothetical protein